MLTKGELDVLRTEALLKLCLRDKRNPDYDDELNDDIEIKVDCYCDHCFYDSHKMAETTLKLIDELTPFAKP